MNTLYKLDKNDLNDTCPFKARKHSSHCLVGDCYFYDEICPIYARYLRLICKSSTISKTIYNPVTETHYEIKHVSTKYGKKGKIVGMWKEKKKENLCQEIK